MTAGAGHTRQDTHGRTYRRPPKSFRGAPDGDKGRGGERANGKAARAHTQKTGQATGTQQETHNRQERTGSERDTDGIRRKRYDIYLRERREKNAAETRKHM